MKNIAKKDFIYVGSLLLLIAVYVAALTHGARVFGSTTDWESQHSVIPEYFRKLFYETRDFFPSFAANIGSGQNIFNFAYYGLYNPFILFSYLLPFVPMRSYVIGASIFSLCLSVFLFYFYLRKTGKKSETALIASSVFLLSGPLLYHSHRHIMFVNYFPFLISAYFGLDRYILKKKPLLLILSVFLMILTSFYYSICGIISILFLAVFKHLRITETFNFKRILPFLFKICIFILAGVLLSCFFLLPTAYSLLAGRGESSSSAALFDISYFMPAFNISNTLYGAYTIGLTSILLLTIISGFISKKKEHVFLSVIFSVFIFVPFINLLSNGFLYVNPKSYIPFMPLCVIFITEFLSEFFREAELRKSVIISFITVGAVSVAFTAFLSDCDKKLIYFFIIDFVITLSAFLLYSKYKKRRIVLFSLFLVMLPMSVYTNFNYDTLVSVKRLNNNNPPEAREMITDALQSEAGENLSRITEFYGSLDSVNNIYSIEQYQSTLYSSTFNLGYRNFYYDTFNNEISHRNHTITNATGNILFNSFIGNKYLVTKRDFSTAGYNTAEQKNGYKLLKNENTLPLGYAAGSTMSEDTFFELGYPYTSEALLKNIVTKSPDNNSFKTSISEYTPKAEIVNYENLTYTSEDGVYHIETDDGAKATLRLADNTSNILFIRFSFDKSQSEYTGDRDITINGIKNKLTAKDARYHNQNYTFDYVISDTKPVTELNISFSKGIFSISDIQIYKMDYSDIAHISQEVDEFIFDKEKTSGDIIAGDIEVTKDNSYFTLSIPYDKGFTATVDGKETEVEKVNVAFIGFPLDKGSHHIEITYSSPLQKEGIIISAGTAVLILGGLLFSRIYKKKNDSRE